MAENTLSVLKIAPGQCPQQVEIDNDLKALQQAVGGSIGASYPFAAPVCRQCSADTHINGDLLGADGTGSVVFHRRFLLLFAKEKDPSGLSLR